MSKASTRTRPVKISSRTRELYEKRDRSLDHADVPQLPPAQWAQGMIGKYYRPLKAELTEVMRDMQSELLRGFAAHSGGITLRVRKVEADQSNLDAALSGRVEILEKRLGEIEQRLGGA